MILLEVKVIKEDMDEIILEERGIDIIKVKCLIIMVLAMTRLEMNLIIIGINGKISKKSTTRRNKTKVKIKRMVKLMYPLTLLFHVVMLD